MANQEHLDILRQGVKRWNKWRRKNPEIWPDLYDADLSGANLSNTDLSGTELSGAKLGGTTFSGAKLSRAYLNVADLSGADLRETDLSGADLSGADLSKANLNGAILNGTILYRANLAGAVIGMTVFVHTALSNVTGLETVRHSRPSDISIGTLTSSGGNIPESFLRGCGLGDWEIESAKLYNLGLNNEEINNIQYRIHDLRVRRAFQIHPLFISYSHSDGAFVGEIEKRLTEQGIRFWRDIHHAVAGRLERQIDQAIYLNDVVLLVLSEHSTKSDWIEHEVRKAREKEKQTNKDTLCPVALDDAWKTCRWPERLREQIMEYNILDFSNWRDAAHFQKMFGKLLEGLNLFYK